MGTDEGQGLNVCAGCGKMFVRESLRLCANCATNEHARFSLVRAYLREHGGRGSITEVARATGLPRAEVGTYIMQGRLIEVDPRSGRPRGSLRADGDGGGDDSGAERSVREAGPEDAERTRYVRRVRRGRRAS